MSPTVKAAGSAPDADLSSSVSTPAGAPYVINLCASTTPMALERPQSKELERFTFFVSRRREEGRERFRLHMGYFDNKAEAEQLLVIIREVYPAAWISEAPGKKHTARRAAPPPAAPAPAASAKRPPPASPASNVREVLAKLDQDPTQQVARYRAQISMESQRQAAQHLQAPSPPRQQTKPAPQQAKPAPGQAQPPSARTKTVPQQVKPQSQQVKPEPHGLKPPPQPKPATGVPHSVESMTGSQDVSDSQVLRVLERKSIVSAEGYNINVVRPHDTLTWREIREEIRRDAQLSFAIQLAWSTTQIDLTRIPKLAIFNSYTLYSIETQRQGQCMFGLRLGFFNDVGSAKQVATYVRSEFAAVAVLPVTRVEREQAKRIGSIELPAGGTPHESTPVEEITLIDDRAPLQLAAAPPVAAPSRPAATTPPAARRAAPRTLEETLEILGASQLRIDGGGERLNVKSRASKPDKQASTFARLLDKLSDKLRT